MEANSAAALLSRDAAETYDTHSRKKSKASHLVHQLTNEIEDLTTKIALLTAARDRAMQQVIVANGIMTENRNTIIAQDRIAAVTEADALRALSIIAAGFTGVVYAVGTSAQDVMDANNVEYLDSFDAELE